MKKTVKYFVNETPVEKEYTYIPFRYILAVLITVLEVLTIIGIVFALCHWVPYFYILAWITQIVCVIRIISSDDNPDYKIPWLLLVMLLPVAGFMLYFLFYSRVLKKKYVRRLQAIKNSSYNKDDSELFAALHSENPAAHNQARMLCAISESHLFTGTKQTYFPSGEAMHCRLLEDLEKAENFIFMEYFIIEEGVFWDSILAVLKQKAARGVTVRVVYDDIGCMLTLPGNYAKILSTYGIEATPFSRLRGNADSEFNNRSHRKITVIDGKIGYTGGINLADEYINAIEKHGHWKDTAIRLEGEAVWALTRLFLIDFGLNTKKMPDIPDSCFPVQQIREDGFLIPFGDGPRPMYNRRAGKSVIQNMLSSATRYMYMTSPYLIIDNDLCQSIENAALRGVDVKIIVPHIPDKKLVFGVTQSFYRRLTDAGVQIYEYEPGFIHAKSYIADDTYAMIGTINLDYRSLVHHFENGVWMYKCQAIQDIKADMEETLTRCVAVSPDTVKASLPQKAIRSLARIFAPML